MTDTGSLRTVCVAVADLIFASRIRAAAGQGGVQCVFARTPEELARHAAGAALVLIDTETRWLDAAAAIRALKADSATRNTEIIVFGPHVNADALTTARAAGADRVMARSAFVKMLPDLLKSQGK